MDAFAWTSLPASRSVKKRSPVASSIATPESEPPSFHGTSLRVVSATVVRPPFAPFPLLLAPPASSSPSSSCSP